MNTKKLLSITQQQIKDHKFKRNHTKYPQSIKDAVITLSKTIPCPKELSSRLGLSKTFIYKTIKLSNKEQSLTSLKSNIPSRADQPKESSNIDFLEITNELKSFMKDDIQPIAPSMRFTTNNGIIVEIFS